MKIRNLRKAKKVAEWIKCANRLMKHPDYNKWYSIQINYTYRASKRDFVKHYAKNKQLLRELLNENSG